MPLLPHLHQLQPLLRCGPTGTVVTVSTVWTPARRVSDGASLWEVILRFSGSTLGTLEAPNPLPSRFPSCRKILPDAQCQ